jgi:preprotein translocase subunit SecF
VGPQVGDELRDQGGLGLLFALAVVMVYVSLRFQFKFAVGAVAALIHDVIIVLGFFSFFKIGFDLTVLRLPEQNIRRRCYGKFTR